MSLGKVLAKLSDESLAMETVMGLGDLTLLAHLRSVAEAHDITLGAVVTRAVNDYETTASPDSWVQLMSTINRADDPGSAALRHMLETSLPRKQEV